MTYRDANGNMSSTIVREENKSKWQLLLVLLQVSAMKLVTQNSTSFQGYEAKQTLYIKAETGEKVLVKVRKSDGVE
jgi:hypothetical protein